MDEPHWSDRAACRGAEDPDAFFPISLSAQHYAQSICAFCPVADRCLAEALSTGADYGVWGGHTPEQRRALRMQEVAR